MPGEIHRNHMIIGLGGTGGNIIRALRKLIYQNYRREDPPNANLRYLFVDSSGEMMKQDDPSWKILGHSVQLTAKSTLQLTGQNLKAVVEDLNQYPHFKEWLGDRSAWAGILGAADAAHVVGGQKRRMGRFLFASCASQFRDRVATAVDELQKTEIPGVGRGNAVTFHVCCGLAGGTGSGSVVDAICQIRKLFPGEHFRINIYALLPERNAPVGKVGPNYHANGYAALVELNALSVGSWKPHDVTVGATRLDLQDPFHCCYLFNDENEANVAVSVGTELPEIVASFLFQKTVEIHKFEWGTTNTLLRRETFEVGAQAKDHETSPGGKPLRTRAFFSFGIKQIAYPEVEIREYLTYAFARAAVLQLLFNKWVEGHGYREEASNHSFAEYVKSKEVQERWYLDDERLTLSQGILREEVNNKKWKPIGEFWKLLIPALVTRVLDDHKADIPKMLPDFTKRCEKVFEEEYRELGVVPFYDTKRGDMRDHVREIRLRIENDLFADWKNGVRAMNDISRLLTTLIHSFEERVNAFDRKISELGEDSSLWKENEEKITENRRQWAKGHAFSWMVGKHKTLLAAQSECLIKRYTWKTRVAGLRFAKDLVTALRQELNGLATEISKANTLISNAAKTFQARIDSRLADKGKQDLSKQVVRFYDPSAVQDFAKNLLVEGAIQKQQTSRVRAELSTLLGDHQTFQNFNNKITEGTFLDTLERTCEKSAEESHNDYVARHPDRGRVLGVSLIESLRREYEGSDERLRSWTRNVMAMASNYLRLEKSEIQKVLPGIPRAMDAENAVCSTDLTVIIPSAEGCGAFRDKLWTAFREASAATAQRVCNADRPHEITLINLTSIMPARFVEALRFLRTKYDARLKEHGERAFLELHSEGTSYELGGNNRFHSLYPESYKPADVYPWVLLAEEMQLIENGKHAETGEDYIYLRVKTEIGTTQQKALGRSAASLVENPDIAAVELLKDQIEPKLATEYQHEEKRRQLAARILVKVEQAKAVHGENHPAYESIEKAYRFIYLKQLRLGAANAS